MGLIHGKRNKGNSLLWFLLDSVGSKLMAAPVPVETAKTLDQYLIKKVVKGKALADAFFCKAKNNLKIPFMVNRIDG